MSILKDVFAELFGMFVGDARLSAAILIVVGVAAGVVALADSSPLIGGGVLLAGCLAVTIGAILRTARAHAREGRAKDDHG